MIAFARARSPDVETEDVVEDEVTSRRESRRLGGHELKRLRKLLRVLFTIDEQIPTHHHDHATVRRRLRVQRHDLVFHLLKRKRAELFDDRRASLVLSGSRVAVFKV